MFARATLIVCTALLFIGCDDPAQLQVQNLSLTVSGSGSVSSSPGGINCPSGPCSASFFADSSVTLQAQANPGQTFSGWSGACGGQAATCSVQMDSDKQVSAQFSGQSNQTLNVSVSGPGTVSSSPSGIDCPGSACSASFPAGTQVTLIPVAIGGATFTGWSGACSGSSACVVTLNELQTVAATFTGGAGTHTLSVTVSGNGSVSSTPGGLNCSGGTCSASFPADSQVMLSPSPTSGSFSGWSGACSGTGTCSVTMSSDQSVSAAFSSGYVLTVVAHGDGVGTVTSDPPGISCTSGSTTGCSYDFGPSAGNVALTAVPDASSSYAGQGSMGNIGCNGQGYAPTCSYGLNNNGVTVDVHFSGWKRRFNFPSNVSGLAINGNVLLAVGAGGNAASSSDDVAGNHGGYWTGHNAPDATHAIAASDGSFYVAADGGMVWSTIDGETWASHMAGSVDLNGITSGAGTLVAVGKTGTIYSSSNGTAWTAANSGVLYDLQAVTYAAGLFVAVGFSGTILSSPDGTTWTARTSGVTNVLHAIAYSQSQFLVVGSAGVVLTSPDGMAWTERTTTGLPADVLRGVAASANTWVTAGDTLDSGGSNHALVYSSSDGLSWTAHDSRMWAEPVLGVAYVAGAFFTLGASGSMARSPDGVSWSPTLPPGGRAAPGNGETDAWSGIAYNGSLYVVTGDWGAIFTSPDGVRWTSRRAGVCCGSLVGVQWGADLATPKFVAAGYGASGAYVLSSTDGITWNLVFPSATPAAGYVVGVAYGGASRGFVVVGSNNVGPNTEGLALTSPDGLSWTASPTAPTQIDGAISSLSYGGNLFVAAGGVNNGGTLEGAIYTSPDGAAWTRQSVPASAAALGPVAYGNGNFVAMEPENQGVFTSQNGIVWTRTAVPFRAGQGFAFGNGVFVNSALYSSSDGTSWTQQSALPDVQNINGGIFLAAIYAAGRWIGVSSYESVLSHP